MLHHISFGVSDLDRAAVFYDAALAPLGYVRVWEDIRLGEPDQAVGYGLPGGGDKLALKHRPEGQRPPGPGFHLAFAAPNRQAIDAFHAAALAHGGKDNGGPGLRPDYGPHYYAAFVIEPDGHHIEAVFNASA
ncbi:VOC family protein [Phyllobacterium sp. 628]|uniref:VOC family protein n=1 Tax=Phyllobacterium sp. 628 TaxID=2718938 RepID=UPI0016627D42|nr:VOC family protein [Phyllobacterium sp. 628]QND52181.1 VOC family protein [Phyllobacterium sp. 628]